MTTETLTHEAIELLKELISIESFSTQENKTAEAIAKFFDKHNVNATRSGNNIIARNTSFDPAKQTILLNSHHDTVKPNAGWTLNPFQPIVKEEKLHREQHLLLTTNSSSKVFFVRERITPEQ